MSFSEAIRDGFSKYVDFSGRSSRSAYWYWALFAFIAYVVALVLDVAIKSPILYIVVVLGLLLPGIAVLFRRLHDTGRSGWWWLIAFVPIAGGIVLLVFTVTDSDPGPNQYGERPDSSPATAPAY